MTTHYRDRTVLRRQQYRASLGCITLTDTVHINTQTGRNLIDLDVAAVPVKRIQRRNVRVDVVGTADTLGRDDSIYFSLKKNGISELQIALLTRAIEKVFRPRTESKPGDCYTLARDTSGVIQHFVYTPSAAPERPVVVELQEGKLVGNRLELPLERQVMAIQARIEDNLFNAIHAAGEGDELAILLADNIFAAVINFHKDLRRGDHIGLVFEKLYLENRFIRYGRILLARYEGRRMSQLAVYYEDPEGRSGYYDDEGNSLARMFLLNPLPYRRISSGFSRRRLHPILKKPRPHLGTDYAAPTGTEVRATAQGRVVAAGWKGGYGKLIELEHANGFRTRYGHLSRIAVRKGQQVQQKEIIGRVGMTGLATGPHLHYELIKNGRHTDPERANRGERGNPLHPRYRQTFAVHRNHLLDRLVAGIHQDSSPVVEMPAVATGAVE